MLDDTKYLMGGQLGDFIHSMIVCSYNFHTYGKKANVYLNNANAPFRFPLKNTYQDLLPVLNKQEWFNNLFFYENQTIDINLENMRVSELLFKAGWNDIYLKTFTNANENYCKECFWFSGFEKQKYLEGCLIINRSIVRGGPLSRGAKSVYEQLINKAPKSYFLCFEEDQYDCFPFKKNVELLKVNSLLEMFCAIYSSKCYIGNLSAPSAIATSLNKPRVIELHSNSIDNIHYTGDTKYYKNLWCV